MCPSNNNPTNPMQWNTKQRNAMLCYAAMCPYLCFHGIDSDHLTVQIHQWAPYTHTNPYTHTDTQTYTHIQYDRMNAQDTSITMYIYIIA